MFSSWTVDVDLALAWAVRAGPCACACCCRVGSLPGHRRAVGWATGRGVGPVRERTGVRDGDSDAMRRTVVLTLPFTRDSYLDEIDRITAKMYFPTDG